MAAFPAENPLATLTTRTGATKGTGNTVPGGSIIVAKNAGAGVHTIKLGSTATYHGAAVTDWSSGNVAAGATVVFRVDAFFADVTNQVVIYTGEATETEVTFFVVLSTV